MGEAVEAVGIGEHGLVAVGRVVGQQQLVARPVGVAVLSTRSTSIALADQIRVSTAAAPDDDEATADGDDQVAKLLAKGVVYWGGRRTRTSTPIFRASSSFTSAVTKGTSSA